MAEDLNFNTYFVTLTFRAGTRAQLWREAYVLSGGATPSRRNRAKPALDRVREWLRRLRNQNKRLSDVKVRYCAVVEYHQSGDPHIHLVVSGDITSKRIRRARWTRGYVHIRKVRPGTPTQDVAGYISKYICKSADSVVTMSKNYGDAIYYRPAPGKEGGQIEYDENYLPLLAGGPSCPSSEEREEQGPGTDPSSKGNTVDTHSDTTVKDEIDLLRFWNNSHLLRMQVEGTYDVERLEHADQLLLDLSTGGPAAKLIGHKSVQYRKVDPAPDQGQERGVRTPPWEPETVRETGD